MAILVFNQQGALSVHVRELPVSYLVDQNESGHSKGAPLFTWGALPCMVAVVHNRGSSSGCMAHIWNNSASHAEIYAGALAILEEMVEVAGCTGGGADVYLMRGLAFLANSPLATRHLQPFDFAVYFNGQVPGHHVHRMLGQTTGDILYWPERNALYDLNAHERGQLQQGMVTGRDMNFFSQWWNGVTVARTELEPA